MTRKTLTLKTYLHTKMKFLGQGIKQLEPEQTGRHTPRPKRLTALLRPGRGAEYCDQFVCLSVRKHYLWNR